MLGGDELAIPRQAQRRYLHEALSTFLDTGSGQGQRRGIVDHVESLATFFAQNSSDIDHGVNARQ